MRQRIERIGYSIPLRRLRFRVALAVFQPPPSAEHFRIRLILSCALPSLQSFRVTAGPALLSGHLPWAFFPHRGNSLRSPHSRASHCPLRSVHDVSHVLDGLLLRLPSRVYFTPQPRPGFALQGLPRVSSRTGSSPAVALLSLPGVPAPVLPRAPERRARLQGFAPLTSPLQYATV